MSKMHLLLVVLLATSSFVTSQDCVDRSSYCFIYKFFCSYSWYRDWLRENCKKTCSNFCPPKPKCGVPQVNLNADNSITSSIATRGSSPWQVVLTLNGKPVCSGSLIASKWVLTAAHCVDGLESFSFAFHIRVGEYNLAIREGSEVDLEVEKIFTHPSYNPATKDNDVSLIKLRKPASLSSNVIPICLPKSDSQLHHGSGCYVTGWRNFHTAIVNEPRLQHAKILIGPQTMCGKSNTTVAKITDHMICIKATKNAGCQGDSGGPFVCQGGPNEPWQLTGVVSWGSRKCGDDPSSFIVFAKVGEFRSWINQIMEN